LLFARLSCIFVEHIFGIELEYTLFIKS